MLNLGNLAVNDVDLVMLGAYAALCLVNRNAYASFILAVLYLAIHATPYRSFYCYMLCSLFYFTAATANIRISIEIRQAFTCFGVIYLLSAADNFISYHFDHDTQMDLALKPAVIVLNAYVLSHLFGDWRRNNVGGLAHYCARALRRYKIRPLHLRQLPENKK